jgi:hypothetical protein
MKEERILLREKETKGTVRFMEHPTIGVPSLVRNVYVEKWCPLSNAEAIKITIEEAPKIES